MFELQATKGRIIPPEFPRERKLDWCRQAERKFFERLTKILPGDWTCIYSHRYTSRRLDKICDGEIDFIILAPSMGILVIELKGGSVHYEGADQTWYQRQFVDSRTVLKKINPIEQAKNGLHAIIRMLYANGKPTDRRVHYAVALPDVHFPQENYGLEVDRNLIIDQSDLEDLESRIEEIFNYSNRDASPWPRGQEVTDFLIAELTKSVTPDSRLEVEIGYEKQFIDILSEEQTSILSGISGAKRVLVTGCAGSGKTILARTIAERLALEGKRTLLTCYNKALAAYLKDQAVPCDYLDIINFHALCKRATGYLRKNVVETSDGWNTYLPMFLKQYMHENPIQRYDAIIIDELQDFPPNFYDALTACLRSKDDGSILGFNDEQQNVRDVESAALIDSKFHLRRNHRNTREIFKLVSKFCEADAEYECTGPPGREIERLEYVRENDLPECLDSVISSLVLVEKVQTRDIVILEQRHDLLTPCTLQCGISITGYDDEKTTSGIQFTTMRKFKGLERPIVIVAGLDHRLKRLPLKLRRRVLYAALSRASSHLILLGTQQGFNLMKEAEL